MKSPKILMGRENPNGWKLADLLEKIRLEVSGKSDQIKGSEHPQKDMIIKSNNAIMSALLEAEALHNETYRKMDELAPNEGPLRPRL